MIQLCCNECEVRARCELEVGAVACLDLKFGCRGMALLGRVRPYPGTGVGQTSYSPSSTLSYDLLTSAAAYGIPLRCHAKAWPHRVLHRLFREPTSTLPVKKLTWSIKEEERVTSTDFFIVS